MSSRCRRADGHEIPRILSHETLPGLPIRKRHGSSFLKLLQNIITYFLPWDAAFGVFQSLLGPPIKFGDLLGRQRVVKLRKFVPDLLDNLAAFFFRQTADLFQNFCRAHGIKLPRPESHEEPIRRHPSWLRLQAARFEIAMDCLNAKLQPAVSAPVFHPLRITPYASRGCLQVGPGSFRSSAGFSAGVN